MDFRSRYRRECMLANTAPLHVIESSLGENNLKFVFFRIPSSEWGPVLTTLESDVTLKRITVTIDHNDYTVNNPTHHLKLKYLSSFIASLSYHVGNNPNLLELCLNGIPLSDESVNLIAQGILSCKSLQHLSLSYCKLSHEQALRILSAVEKKPNLVWLELCSCGLTFRCKQGLYSLVHNQTVARENAAWKASLRQETSSLDLMGGLRRLSLNDNDLGEAINQLALAVAQDSCLKAIDLQFCHLENDHLELLIEASSKNPALIFIDISNNSGLDKDLVKELKEILKSKTSNDSELFTSLDTSKHPCVSNPLNEKSSGKLKPLKRTQTTPAPRKIPARVPSKTTTVGKPIQIPKLAANAKTKRDPDLVQKSEDLPEVSLCSMRKELQRERELRLDAERQVIKIYGEMESTWLKIQKLEKEVKKLKKQNAFLLSGSYAISNMPMQPTLLVDQPTLQDFHICLGQLRTILQRLSCGETPMLSSLNMKGNGIEGILRNLHKAVNDLAVSVNIPEKESPNLQLNCVSKSSPILSYFTQPSNILESQKPFSATLQPKEREVVYNPTKRASNDSHYPSIEEKKSRDEKCDNPAPYLSSGSRFETDLAQSKEVDIQLPKKVAKHRNLTSTPLSGVTKPIIKPTVSSSSLQLNESKKPKTAVSISASDSSISVSSPSHSIKEKILSQSSSTNSIRKPEEMEKQLKQDSIPIQNESKDRVYSLKNLQNNLEGLLQQFQTREVPQLELSRRADSLLPPNEGISVSESVRSRNERTEYSMDFDSTCTSIRTLSNELKKFSNASHSGNNAHVNERSKVISKTVKDKQHSSRSSSTLNLSSIVDLLGDFSVGDIGSSTITPP